MTNQGGGVRWDRFPDWEKELQKVKRAKTSFSGDGGLMGRQRRIRVGEIQKFIERNGRKVFLLEGAAGVGKSAAITHLAEQFRNPVSYYFSRQNSALGEPEKFQRYLCAKLAEVWGIDDFSAGNKAEMHAATEAALRAAGLKARAGDLNATETGSNGRCLIFLDGWEEIEATARMEHRKILNQSFPGVTFVVAVHPGRMSVLEHDCHSFELEALDEGDVIEILGGFCPGTDSDELKRCARQIEGNAFYLGCILKAAKEEGRLTPAKDCPKGVVAYFEALWQECDDSLLRDALSVLAWDKEKQGFSTETLMEILKVADRDKLDQLLIRHGQAFALRDGDEWKIGNQIWVDQIRKCHQGGKKALAAWCLDWQSVKNDYKFLNLPDYIVPWRAGEKYPLGRADIGNKDHEELFVDLMAGEFMGECLGAIKERASGLEKGLARFPEELRRGAGMALKDRMFVPLLGILDRHAEASAAASVMDVQLEVNEGRAESALKRALDNAGGYSQFVQLAALAYWAEGPEIRMAALKGLREIYRSAAPGELSRPWLIYWAKSLCLRISKDEKLAQALDEFPLEHGALSLLLGDMMNREGSVLCQVLPEQPTWDEDLVPLMLSVLLGPENLSGLHKRLAPTDAVRLCLTLGADSLDICAATSNAQEPFDLLKVLAFASKFEMESPVKEEFLKAAKKASQSHAATSDAFLSSLCALHLGEREESRRHARELVGDSREARLLSQVPKRRDIQEAVGGDLEALAQCFLFESPEFIQATRDSLKLDQAKGWASCWHPLWPRPSREFMREWLMAIRARCHAKPREADVLEQAARLLMAMSHLELAKEALDGIWNLAGNAGAAGANSGASLIRRWAEAAAQLLSECIGRNHKGLAAGLWKQLDGVSRSHPNEISLRALSVGLDFYSVMDDREGFESILKEMGLRRASEGSGLKRLGAPIRRALFLSGMKECAVELMRKDVLTEPDIVREQEEVSLSSEKLPDEFIAAAGNAMVHKALIKDDGIEDLVWPILRSRAARKDEKDPVRTLCLNMLRRQQYALNLPLKRAIELVNCAVNIEIEARDGAMEVLRRALLSSLQSHEPTESLDDIREAVLLLKASHKGDSSSHLGRLEWVPLDLQAWCAFCRGDLSVAKSRLQEFLDAGHKRKDHFVWTILREVAGQANEPDFLVKGVGCLLKQKSDWSIESFFGIMKAAKDLRNSAEILKALLPAFDAMPGASDSQFLFKHFADRPTTVAGKKPAPLAEGIGQAFVRLAPHLQENEMIRSCWRGFFWKAVESYAVEDVVAVCWPKAESWGHDRFRHISRSFSRSIINAAKKNVAPDRALEWVRAILPVSMSLGFPDWEMRVVLEKCEKTELQQIVAAYLRA